MRWTEFAVREARQTLDAWEKHVGVLKPPIAVEDLADLLYHLAIDPTVALPHTLAGRLYAEQRIIEVRRTDHPRRQRFTIAHEVGHYRLHVLAEGHAKGQYACLEHEMGLDNTELPAALLLREAPLPGFTVSSPRSAQARSERDVRRHEIEANAFAAELLMPAMMIERAFERYGKDVRALAEHFDVSQQAMQIRLEKLLLVAPAGPQMSFLGEL